MAGARTCRAGLVRVALNLSILGSRPGPHGSIETARHACASSTTTPPPPGRSSRSQCRGGLGLGNGGGRGPPSNSTGTTKRPARDGRLRWSARRSATRHSPQRHSPLATRHSPLATRQQRPPPRFLLFGFRLSGSRPSAQRRRVIVGRSRQTNSPTEPLLIES